ncbi:MAG TPA: hypothetical protein VGN54_14330 [Mycobacteriales bacterium]|nr:hypothetical protein [Mycobacteriales bacterium]
MSVAPVARKTAPSAGGRVPFPRRPMLRLAPAPTRSAPRAPFLILVFLLLGGGLVGLLLLNTTRAQDAFTLARLQNANAILVDREQALRQVVQGDQDPARLAARAKALGMVPGRGPAFVDAHGKVVGAAPPGAPTPGPNSLVQQGVLVALPAPPQPSIAPSTGRRTQPAAAPPLAPASAKPAVPKPAATKPVAATPTPGASGPGRHGTPTPAPTAHPTSHPPVPR